MLSITNRYARDFIAACKPVVTFATCNNDPDAGAGTNRPLTAPWGVGPDISDRAAMVAAALHDRQFQRVAIVPGGGADFLRDAIEAWGIQLVPQQAEAVATDGDWASVDELRGFPVYGLDRLDTGVSERSCTAGSTNDNGSCRNGSW